MTEKNKGQYCHKCVNAREKATPRCWICKLNCVQRNQTDVCLWDSKKNPSKFEPLLPGGDELMRVKVIRSNRSLTAGIVEVPIKKTSQQLPGYFDKKYLKRALKYLNTLDGNDVKVAFKVDAEKEATMLLFYPDEEKKIAVACAGKTKREA